MVPGSVPLQPHVLPFHLLGFSGSHPKLNAQTQDLIPYTLTQTEHLPANSVFVGSPGTIATVQTHSAPIEASVKADLVHVV